MVLKPRSFLRGRDRAIEHKRDRNKGASHRFSERQERCRHKTRSEQNTKQPRIILSVFPQPTKTLSSFIMTQDISPNDVLCGRGGATNNHVGNRRFRAIVAAHQREYLQARKMEKVLIARQIVAAVHASGGRYLKRSKSSDTWIEVPVKQATSKTSQALREGLDVRNRTVRKQTSHDGDSVTSDNEGRVVTGRVSVSSPALVSLSGPNEVPDLRDDFLPAVTTTPAFLHYNPQPPSRATLEQAFEV